MIVFMLIIASVRAEELPPSCGSPVYCYGSLLSTVQMARIFNDSKTFVDMKMKYPQEEVLWNFNSFQEQTGKDPSKAQVRQFVKSNFEEGNELVSYDPKDFTPRPHFTESIKNESIRNFSLELVKIWPSLARRVKDEVRVNKERYSFIPVPNGFIIPGGRFREYYYWDSYWIIEGLLISEMKETAKGMIDNFISLVQQFGFIPNGGRIYYLKRSQPPLLTAMAQLYLQYTKDVDWLSDNIRYLAKELKYWNNQSVQVQKHSRNYTLFHYAAESEGPRPESFYEDINTAGYFFETSLQQQVYQDLKSGAESGWDFSNRWIFDEHGGNNANLSHIQTRRVVPVDLNAFLCQAYGIIARFYTILGDNKSSAFWKTKHHSLKEAIHAVLWDKRDGIWYDYDLRTKTHRRFFYPSNVAPLWSSCYTNKSTAMLVLKYLVKNEILDYLGGVPTSKEHSGEQWDFPNAWPPLQDLIVGGLANTAYAPALEKARELAKRWVESNLIGFEKTGKMFEKYDAVVPGQYGAGGEYQVQDGFGWSNGVTLKFINNYYRR